MKFWKYPDLEYTEVITKNFCDEVECIEVVNDCVITGRTNGYV